MSNTSGDQARDASSLAVLPTQSSLLRRGKIGVKGKGEMVTYWVAPPTRDEATKEAAQVKTQGVEFDA